MPTALMAILALPGAGLQAEDEHWPQMATTLPYSPCTVSRNPKTYTLRCRAFALVSAS